MCVGPAPAPCPRNPTMIVWSLTTEVLNTFTPLTVVVCPVNPEPLTVRNVGPKSLAQY